eukprot:scaffold265092_cov41-Prasinocladus_malaysianus.AAC.1
MAANAEGGVGGALSDLRESDFLGEEREGRRAGAQGRHLSTLGCGGPAERAGRNHFRWLRIQAFLPGDACSDDCVTLSREMSTSASTYSGYS